MHGKPWMVVLVGMVLGFGCRVDGGAATGASGATTPAWSAGVWTRELVPVAGGGESDAWHAAIDAIESESTAAWAGPAGRYDTAAAAFAEVLVAGGTPDATLVDTLVTADAEMRAVGLTAAARTFAALAPPAGPAVDLDGTEPVLPFFPQPIVASVAAQRRTLSAAVQRAGLPASPAVQAILARDTQRLTVVEDAIQTYRVRAIAIDFDRPGAAERLAALAAPLGPALDTSLRARLALVAELVALVPAADRAAFVRTGELAGYAGLPAARGGRAGLLAALASTPRPRGGGATNGSGPRFPPPPGGVGALGGGSDGPRFPPPPTAAGATTP